MESLEERNLLAVIIVSNASDAGLGTLRQAILQSNESLEKDQIVFAIPGIAPKITLQTPLPLILNPVVIDATTQPGYAGRPVVQLDGRRLTGGVFSAFSLRAGDSTVRGLALTSFDNAIFVTGPGGNTIEGNWIGLPASGVEEAGNSLTGVFIVDSSNNMIGGRTALTRNVISGSGQYGIRINGVTSQANRIQGNYIGTNATGTAAVPNKIDGILLADGSSNTLIGTDGDGIGDATEGNVVSGNTKSGIELYRSSQNIVAGNFLGTNASGSAALPNGDHGLVISGDATANRIGTNGNGRADAAERNLISGNARSGVAIFQAAGNVVAGNMIGTSLSGRTPLKNGAQGILLTDNAKQNRIGTNGDGVADQTEGNLISGNGTNGITIWNSHQNTVAGNLVGLSVAGDAALPNGHSGLWVTFASAQNLIGTNDDGVNDHAERNIISGNLLEGVAIQQAPSNRVAGNYIGTDQNGTAAIGNANGVWVLASASTVIGTDGRSRSGSAAGNVIAGNRTNGILLHGAGTSGSQIGGNLIGLEADGITASPNALSGIAITNGADNNAIGGDRPQQRNIISRNDRYGIALSGQSRGTTILGNRIGLAADGLTERGNALAGISIDASFDNAVGAESVQAANEIAFNGPRGIVIENETAQNNRIERNSIHGHSLVGIDLGSDGTTPNDALDADSGPNSLQNYPDIDLVTSTAGKTQAAGRLAVTAGTDYLLRFYTKRGAGNLIEDVEYLGSKLISAELTGELNWIVEFPLEVATDRAVIATARSSSSGTSEFSQSSNVMTLLPVSIQVTETSEGGAPLQASVSRGTLAVNRTLVISLASSHSERVFAPAQIEIPAGQNSASFNITIRDDTVYEAPESVVITARLLNEATGAAAFTLSDNDSAWHNYALTMDVNGDGSVSPLDALIVINALNQIGAVPVANLSQPSDGSEMYVDTNLDDFLSPIDALLVINFLNGGAGSSEGEASPSFEEGLAERVLDLASVDQVYFDMDGEQRKHRGRR